jgi:hypothetical protein
MAKDKRLEEAENKITQNDQPIIEDSDDSLERAFLYRRLYPDAEAALTFVPKPVEELFSEAIIAIDANVLLLPYTVRAQSLSSILEAYRTLRDTKRLLVPAHAAREFAKRRPEKIAAVVDSLSSRALDAKPAERSRYPLLNSEPEFEALIKIEEEYNNQSRDLSEKHKEASRKVVDKIKAWQREDPVLSMYREVLPGTIVDTAKTDEEIISDAAWRKKFAVPPGYKDSGKKQNYAGDVIIWHTLLEVGAAKKMSMIFVTEEQKPDWWHKLSGSISGARHELVDEYRRITGGQAFQVVSFSRFLELADSPKEIIDDVKRAEEIIATTKTILEQGRKNRVQRRYLEKKAIQKTSLKLKVYLEYEREVVLEDNVTMLMDGFGEANNEIYLAEIIFDSQVSRKNLRAKMVKFTQACAFIASQRNQLVIPVITIISEEKDDWFRVAARSIASEFETRGMSLPIIYFFSSSELAMDDENIN